MYWGNAIKRYYLGKRIIKNIFDGIGHLLKSSQNRYIKNFKKIITKYGAVSVQCCLAMVNNLYKISKSKVCISITGIAGPKGGSKQKPVGSVYIGIRVGKKVVINKCNFKNKGRIYVQRETVKKSLNLLLKLIK